MVEHEEPADSVVPCVRLQVARTVVEHLDCPYCFGRRTDVAQGIHAEFCDYDQELDPICFGFPEGISRLR